MADFYLHYEINRFNSFKKSIYVEVNFSISYKDTFIFYYIDLSLLFATLGASYYRTTYCLSLPNSFDAAKLGT